MHRGSLLVRDGDARHLVVKELGVAGAVERQDAEQDRRFRAPEPVLPGPHERLVRRRHALVEGVVADLPGVVAGIGDGCDIAGQVRGSGGQRDARPREDIAFERS